MAIPDYQSIMLPLLRLLADGQTRTSRSCIDSLADHFSLTDEERRELLPSGKQPTFDNRVGWAKTYMGKAGLLVAPKRGHWCITDRGQEVLEQRPKSIDVPFLEQFDEFIEFRQLRRESTNLKERAKASNERSYETPEETLEQAHQSLRKELTSDILAQVRGCSWQFFERLVVDLLVKMGYGGSRREAGQAIGKSGDEGIDGIIKEDRLGLDIIYVQAKKWENVVGRPEIQKFAGALQGQRARKGIFLTTSNFSREADAYVSSIDTKIILIDGDRLAELMIDHGVGVTTETTYEVKRLDTDYFSEE